MDDTDATVAGLADGRIEQSILALVAECKAGSICPSEVARAVGEAATWRSLMGAVRRAAGRLSQEGRIEILRKGRVIQPADMHGVIRLRLVRPPGD